jgi:hypothetical protein
VADKTEAQSLQEIVRILKEQNYQNSKKDTNETAEKRRSGSSKPSFDKLAGNATTALGKGFNITMNATFKGMAVAFDKALNRAASPEKLAAQKESRDKLADTVKKLSEKLERLQSPDPRDEKGRFLSKEAASKEADITKKDLQAQTAKLKASPTGDTAGDTAQRQKKRDAVFETLKKTSLGIQKTFTKIGDLTGITKALKGIQDTFKTAILGGAAAFAAISFLEGLKKASEWFGENASFGEILISGLTRVIGNILGYDEEEQKALAVKIKNFFTGIGDFFERTFTSIKKVFEADGILGKITAFAKEFPILSAILVAFLALPLLKVLGMVGAVGLLLGKFMKRGKDLSTKLTKSNPKPNVNTKPKPNIKQYPAGTTIDGKKVGGQTYNANKQPPKNLKLPTTTNTALDAGKNITKKAGKEIAEKGAKVVAGSVMRKVTTGALGLLIPGAGWVMTAAMVADLGYTAFDLAKNTDTGRNFLNKYILGDKTQIKDPNAPGPDNLTDAQRNKILNDQQRMQGGQTTQNNNIDNSIQTKNETQVKIKPYESTNNFGEGPDGFSAIP